MLQFLCATDDRHSFEFFHVSMEQLLLSIPFQACLCTDTIRDILIFNKKYNDGLKMKTYIVWAVDNETDFDFNVCIVRSEKLDKKRCVISKFFISFFGA